LKGWLHNQLPLKNRTGLPVAMLEESFQDAFKLWGVHPVFNKPQVQVRNKDILRLLRFAK
jgi:hypothetical protein